MFEVKNSAALPADRCIQQSGRTEPFCESGAIDACRNRPAGELAEEHRYAGAATNWSADLQGISHNREGRLEIR